MTTSEIAFVAFKDQLSRYISRRLGAVQDVEDILQDVFVRAARNEDKLGEAAKPLAWLFTVTNSVIADHYRKKARGLPQCGGDGIDDIPALLPLDEQDFGRCLQPLIRTLPCKYRETLLYVDIKGGAQNQLAKDQNTPVSTIKSRVQRGRRMLKTAILKCCYVETDDAGVILSPRNDCC